MSAQHLLTDLTNDLQSFLSKVSSIGSFKTEISKLVELWGKAPETILTTVSKVEKKGRTKDYSNGPKCDYVFQRGKNPGKVCEDPICTDSTSKCRKHLKFEGSLPSAKGSSVISSAKEIAATVTKPLTTRPVSAQLTISRNQYGNYEHKSTNLVFNSEKKVFGKQVGEKVLSLSVADVENCKRNNFKYTPEAVAKPESTVPAEDEVEVEELEVEEVEVDEHMEELDEDK